MADMANDREKVDCEFVSACRKIETNPKTDAPGVTTGAWIFVSECAGARNPAIISVKIKIKMTNKMKAKQTTHWRQGDVLIEMIDTIPATATKQKQSKAIILAHGEVTGHHHTLELEKPVDWWKQGDISTANEKPRTLAGELYVTLPWGGVVTHQEHAKIELPKGTYRITRQREYSPEAIRNVAD